MYLRARLTFDLSAKVVHVGLQLIYLNVFLLVVTKPIELKSNMEHPLDVTM